MAVRFWAEGREVGEMTLDRAVRRPVAHATLSPFVSLLALAALLFAVFAFHSEAAGHPAQTPVPTSTAAASSAVAEPQSSVTQMAAVLAAPVVAAISSGSLDGLLHCALLAMTCVLLLTLVVMVFLTRLPAMYRRLLDAGGIMLRSLITSALPVHRPSLTILSISRV